MVGNELGTKSTFPTNQGTREFFSMPQDEASKVRLQEAKKDLAALGEELAPLRARYQQAHLGKVEAMETRYELSR